MMWNGPFGFADGWSWFWPFHFIIPLLFLALIITVVVLIVRYTTAGAVVHHHWSGARPALTFLSNATRVVRSTATNILRRSETSLDKGARSCPHHRDSNCVPTTQFFLTGLREVRSLVRAHERNTSGCGKTGESDARTAERDERSRCQ
jgi:hypothetical protein